MVHFIYFYVCITATYTTTQAMEGGRGGGRRRGIGGIKARRRVAAEVVQVGRVLIPYTYM